MRLRRLIIENYRGYRESTSVTFADFTSVIGKNNVGKSTLLEALEIFFNNKNPDSDDAHVQARNGGGAERSQNPDAGRRPMACRDSQAGAVAPGLNAAQVLHRQFLRFWPNSFHKPRTSSEWTIKLPRCQ